MICKRIDEEYGSGMKSLGRSFEVLLSGESSRHNPGRQTPIIANFLHARGVIFVPRENILSQTNADGKRTRCFLASMVRCSAARCTTPSNRHELGLGCMPGTPFDISCRFTMRTLKNIYAKTFIGETSGETLRPSKH